MNIPLTPAGRFETVQLWLDEGYITRANAWRLLGMSEGAIAELERQHDEAYRERFAAAFAEGVGEP